MIHEVTHYTQLIQNPLWLSMDELVIAAVEENDTIFQHLPAKQRRNMKIVKAAVSKNGLNLQWADEKLRADKSVVALAIGADDERKAEDDYKAIQYSLLDNKDNKIILEGLEPELRDKAKEFLPKIAPELSNEPAPPSLSMSLPPKNWMKPGNVVISPLAANQAPGQAQDDDLSDVDYDDPPEDDERTSGNLPA